MPKNVHFPILQSRGEKNSQILEKPTFGQTIVKLMDRIQSSKRMLRYHCHIQKMTQAFFPKEL